mmetsp:Transcript_114599/g.304652  ORF Transcript_114599/g.304652 Transcript_114599/m.304652 type:complete len:110 (+) Transcript_114599:1810-2139(+)
MRHPVSWADSCPVFHHELSTLNPPVALDAGAPLGAASGTWAEPAASELQQDRLSPLADGQQAPLRPSNTHPGFAEHDAAASDNKRGLFGPRKLEDTPAKAGVSSANTNR